MKIRQPLAVLAVAALAIVAGPAPAARAEPLDRATLEQLRDTVAATAPVGSVTYVDSQRGVVVLETPGPGTAAARAASARYPGRVQVTEGASAVKPLALIYGGMAMDTAYLERRCSTGFLAQGGGWYFLLTAGHCVANTSGSAAVWYTEGGYNSGGLIGVRTTRPYYPGDDFANIQISRITPHQYAPSVLHHGSPRPVRGVGTARPPQDFFPGSPVCKTGRTTGTTCGFVTRVNVSVTYHDGVVSGLIESSVCAGPGDSGGPLYGNDVTYAYGIVSGGNSFPCGTSGFRSYHQPVREALTAYGLTLVVAP
ncbi:S1 family peptidase [Allorhizocola rhizosphaerae]|uniref:S1 family peptidase n=1 Tax=Allorhizocola rhizosphaerae TaxID=1872709 RepID=UPI0013C30B53|nr:S1 family peptidase [Allorhizocola rhizosphaerae]